MSDTFKPSPETIERELRKVARNYVPRESVIVSSEIIDGVCRGTFSWECSHGYKHIYTVIFPWHIGILPPGSNNLM